MNIIQKIQDYLNNSFGPTLGKYGLFIFLILIIAVVIVVIRAISKSVKKRPNKENDEPDDISYRRVNYTEQVTYTDKTDLIKRIEEKRADEKNEIRKYEIFEKSEKYDSILSETEKELAKVEECFECDCDIETISVLLSNIKTDELKTIAYDNNWDDESSQSGKVYREKAQKLLDREQEYREKI